VERCGISRHAWRLGRRRKRGEPERHGGGEEEAA
jgi:hypothetical protein